jgi:hypothetical protein
VAKLKTGDGNQTGYCAHDREDIIMTDQQIITQAYEEKVKTLFSTFCDAWSLAKNTDGKMDSEQHFQKGIQLARQARDRAIAILPPA